MPTHMIMVSLVEK